MHTEKTHRQTCKFLSFQLGTRKYLCDTVNLQEIVKHPGIIINENSTSWHIGTFTGSRNGIPVIDLFCRDRETLVRSQASLIVINVEGWVLGLLVDSVNEILEIIPSNALPYPQMYAGIEGEFISGIIEHEGNDFYIINLEKLISTVHGEA